MELRSGKIPVKFTKTPKKRVSFGDVSKSDGPFTSKKRLKRKDGGVIEISASKLLETTIQVALPRRTPPLSNRRRHRLFMNTETETDFFSKVPHDMVREIFSYLPYTEKRSLWLVNKTWLEVAKPLYPPSKDVVFVCDTTGSMRNYLPTIRQRLVAFMEKESQKDSRYAFVSYKDHDASASVDPVTSFIGFTKDSKEITKFFDDIVPGGGADEAEAVVDGLREALNFKWRGNGIEKAIILFCDAPSHGTPGVGGDRHPTGCPCGTKESDMLKLMQEKYIQFYVISLADGLDRMLDNFRAIYPAMGVRQLTVELHDLFRHQKKAAPSGSPKTKSAN